MQDGATPHTATAARNLLHSLFPGHVIGKFMDIPYPPCSLDLNPLDFFFWGMLKDEVYRETPLPSHIACRAAIQRAFDNFRAKETFPHTLAAVFCCLQRRLEEVPQRTGNFVELRAVPM